MSIRDPSWGQDNPRDQIKASLGAIRMWIENLEQGISSPEWVAGAVRDACDRIEQYTRVPDMDRWPDKERAALVFRALDMSLDTTIPMQQANDAGEPMPEGWERDALDKLHDAAKGEMLRLTEEVTTTAADLIDLDETFAATEKLLAQYEDPNGAH